MLSMLWLFSRRFPSYGGTATLVFGKAQENIGLSLASDTEAYAGHLGKARELTKRSVDSAIHADSKETERIWQEIAAQREAAFGNLRNAKQAAADGLKLSPPSPGSRPRPRLRLPSRAMRHEPNPWHKT